MRWHLSWRYGHVILVSRYRFDTCQLTIIWMSIIRLKTGYGSHISWKIRHFTLVFLWCGRTGEQISKEAVIKTKNATIAFFSSPPFLLFALCLLSFSFVTVILELLGLKKPALTPVHSNDCKFRQFGFQKICQMLTKNSTILSKCAISKWQAAFQVIWHQCCSFRRIQIHTFIVTP